MNKAAERVPQRRSGDTFPIRFDRGGVFRAHAALDGASVGVLVVNVM